MDMILMHVNLKSSTNTYITAHEYYNTPFTKMIDYYIYCLKWIYSIELIQCFSTNFAISARSFSVSEPVTGSRSTAILFR